MTVHRSGESQRLFLNLSKPALIPLTF